MNFREKRNKLKNEIKELQKKTSKLIKKEYELGAELNSINLGILIEEDILSKINWVLPSSFGITKKDICLQGGITYNTKDGEKLSELFEDNYHCEKELQNGVILRFDDSEMTLIIKKEIVDKVIKEYKLKINTENIDKAIKDSTFNLEMLQKTRNIIKK
jgi:hypothetical protein